MAKKSPVSMDNCGMAMAIDILGDRWSLLILRAALYGVTRFDDIRTDINIPKSVLSQRLAHLVRKGILMKMPYQEEGSRRRFSYEPTEVGKEFTLPLLAIMQWGDRHVRQGDAPITLTDRATGQEVNVELARKYGGSIPVSKMRLRLNATQ
jgi:DNA-binding HxlR family transcriptional regulator